MTIDISDNYGQVSPTQPKPADGMTTTGGSIGKHIHRIGHRVVVSSDCPSFRRLVGLWTRTAMTSETRGKNDAFRGWLSDYLEIDSVHRIFTHDGNLYLFVMDHPEQWTAIEIEHGPFETVDIGSHP